MISKSRNIFLILSVFLVFSCNNKKIETLNKFKKAENDFVIAVNQYEKCKTEYEYSNNHKVIIDVRNGSGKKGLAKKISDHLIEKCYDTYYGNWENFNEFNTRIIIYNNNSNLMAKELKNILDANIEFERKRDTTKIVHMTLIIGKDYKKLSFYKDLSLKTDE